MRRERPIPQAMTGRSPDALDRYLLDLDAYDSGDRLDHLLIEIAQLQIDLGYPHFSRLAPWCDSDPRTCDEGELERLIERLCILWVNRGNGEIYEPD